MAEHEYSPDHPHGRDQASPDPLRQAARVATAIACLLLLQTALSLHAVAYETAWVGPPAAALAVPLSLAAGVACLVAGRRCRPGGGAHSPRGSAGALIVSGVIVGPFGVALLALPHRGPPYDLFYYEGGGGFWSAVVGVACALVGTTAFVGGLGVWKDDEVEGGGRTGRGPGRDGGQPPG